MKIDFTNTLKFRLYAWYFLSLIVLSIYFYVIVHILMLPHSDHIFLFLLSVMGLSGFVVVKNTIKPISDLTTQISSLDKKKLNTKMIDTSNAKELQILTQAFNKLLQEVSDTLSREQQFIGDMAHEIKTPLATLQTTLEVGLRSNRSEKEYQKIISEALKDANRIKNTLNQVLDLAWTESQQTNHSFEKINLSQLLDEVADIGAKLALDKNIDVRFDMSEDIYVKGQRDKLAQMFINIVENAINYTEKGSVNIGASINKNSIIVTIADTGKGISHNDLDKVFDRFYRGESSKNTKGTGIGLPIAKSIAKLHGGYIEVNSEINTGSTFSVIMPIFQDSSVLTKS